MGYQRHQKISKFVFNHTHKIWFKIFFPAFPASLFEKTYYFTAFPAYFLENAIFPAFPALPASVDTL